MNPLDNNFDYDIEIDGKVWRSVTNYIYTNLIPNTLYNRWVEVENANPNVVEKHYNIIIAELEQNSISSSINKGLQEKINKTPRFLKILEQTGLRDIIYLSVNSYIGIGKNFDGYNLYGKRLENFRNNKKNNIYSYSEDDIYDFYLAENGLKHALQFENLRKYESCNDLISIIKQLVKKYGSATIFILDKKTATSLFKKYDRDLYMSPVKLIKYIRKKYIRIITDKNIRIRKKKAFIQFLQKICENKEEYDSSYINQFIEEIPLKILDNLINRFWNLRGVININIKDNLFIPSENEIMKYEKELILNSDNFISENKKNSNDEVNVYIYPTLDYPIIRNIKHDFNNDFLSPNNDSDILIIDNLKYPSISHFIIAMLAKLIPIRENKFYDIIYNLQNKMFFNIKESEYNYNIIKSTNYKELYNYFLKKSISFKVKYRLIQDYILAENYEFYKFENNIIEIYRKFFKSSVILPENKIISSDEANNLLNYIEHDEFFKYFIKNFCKELLIIYINCMNYSKINDILRAFFPYLKQDKLITDIPLYVKNLCNNYGVVNEEVITILYNNIINLLIFYSDILNNILKNIIFKNNNKKNFYYLNILKTFIINSFNIYYKKKRKLKFKTFCNNTIYTSALINIITILQKIDIKLDKDIINLAINILKGNIKTVKYADLQDYEDVQEEEEEIYDEALRDEENDINMEYDNELPEFNEDAVYENNEIFKKINSIKTHLKISDSLAKFIIEHCEQHNHVFKKRLYFFAF